MSAAPDFASLANAYLTATTPAPVAAAPSLVDGVTGALISGAEIVGSGAFMAYLNARAPAPGKNYHAIGGYPIDVLAGGGLFLVGLLGLAMQSPGAAHFVRLGLGCLCESAIRVATERAKEAAGPAQLPEEKVNLRLVEQTPATTASAAVSGALSKSSGQSVFEPVR